MCDFIGFRCKVCSLNGVDYEKNKLKSIIFLLKEGGKEKLYYRSKNTTNFELCKILNHLQQHSNNNKCYLIKILKNILGLSQEIEIVKIY